MKQICYRVYFTPVEPEQSLAHLRATWRAASIFHGQGLWESKIEDLTVYEIHTSEIDGLIFANWVETLRAINHQEAVRITKHEIEVQDVSSPV